MFLGNAIDIVAQRQRQIGHIQPLFVADRSLIPQSLAVAEHVVHQFQWELVVSGWNRRVGRENALLPNGMRDLRAVISAADRPFPVARAEVPASSSRMAFVHVVSFEFRIQARNMRTPPIPKITSWQSR